MQSRKKRQSAQLAWSTVSCTCASGWREWGLEFTCSSSVLASGRSPRATKTTRAIGSQFGRRLSYGTHWYLDSFHPRLLAAFGLHLESGYDGWVLFVRDVYRSLQMQLLRLPPSARGQFVNRAHFYYCVRRRLDFPLWISRSRLWEKNDTTRWTFFSSIGRRKRCPGAW